MSKIKNISIDIIMYAIGSLIFAVSINSFTAPNNIAPGGLAGASTMINYLFNIPIGLMIIILNIPIFFWGLKAVGFKVMSKTLAGIITTSAAIDLTAKLLPVYRGDMFIVTIFGGVFAGIGLSLIFIRGGTTGGTDLAANLISKKIRHLSLGHIMLMIDLVIVSISAFVYKNFESPLYASIVIFITTKVVDTVLYGMNAGSGKMMFIISPCNEDISAEIMRKMKRGVTKLKSRGSFSGNEGEILLCAVRRHEVYKTYDIIYSVDPDAFIIVGDAGEITGEGFNVKC